MLSVDPMQVFIPYAMAELSFGGHLTVLQTNGTLSAERAQQWWEYLRQADEHGTLLISFTAFVIVGTNHAAHVAAIRQAEADQDQDDRDDTYGDEALHHDSDDVLGGTSPP